MIEYTLEKEGEGRYVVLLKDNSRAGLVMGGNSRWYAESTDGQNLGWSWTTRKEAAQFVADDASDPLWPAMWQIANRVGMPRWNRKSDLVIDRRTLREWRGKTDFLWVLTPEGTHTIALDPPMRQEHLLKQVNPNIPDLQAYLIRSGRQGGGITRVRKDHLTRMISLLR